MITVRCSQFVVVLLLASQLPGTTTHVVATIPSPPLSRCGSGCRAGAAVERVQRDAHDTPGLGVGVRVGRQYVLFERRWRPSSRSRESRRRIRRSRPWLVAGVLSVRPRMLSDTDRRGVSGCDVRSSGLCRRRLEERAHAREGDATSRDDDRARFRLTSGVDPRARARHRSTGHALVSDASRRAAPGSGHVSAVRDGARADTLLASASTAWTWRRFHEAGRRVRLRVAVRDPVRRSESRRSSTSTNADLHLFIVSRDLGQFAHVHPARKADGVFELRHDLRPVNTC